MTRRQPGWPIVAVELPKYIIVDLANFMYLAQFGPMVSQLGSCFPIRAMISTVLAFNQYIGYEEAFWLELERKFPDLDKINRDILEIYLEGFVLDLDEFIRHKVPPTTDTGQYIIDRWLDSTTVVLKHDESSWMFCDTRATNNSYPEKLGYTRPVRVVRVQRGRPVPRAL